MTHADNHFDDAYLVSGFDKFAPDGSETISTDVVEVALQRLTESSASVKKYTNKVLAHRERAPGDIEMLTPTFGDINAALDEAGRVMQQFYGLRHPGTQLLTVNPIPDLRFVEMFEVPWCSEAWEPPDDSWDQIQRS